MYSLANVCKESVVIYNVEYSACFFVNDGVYVSGTRPAPNASGETKQENLIPELVELKMNHVCSR